MIKYSINYQGDDLDEMYEGNTAFVILRLLLDFEPNRRQVGDLVQKKLITKLDEVKI